MFVTNCSSKLFEAVAYAALCELQKFGKKLYPSVNMMDVELSVFDVKWAMGSHSELRRCGYISDSTVKKAIKFYNENNNLFKTIVKFIVEQPTITTDKVYDHFSKISNFQSYWFNQRDPLHGMISAANYFIYEICSQQGNSDDSLWIYFKSTEIVAILEKVGYPAKVAFATVI